MERIVVEEALQRDETDSSTYGNHLHISLLGEFFLRCGDTAVPLKTPSYQALLAYLIIHTDQAHPRQSLAFHFWPDSTEKQARTNLRKALYRLRKTLPDADALLKIGPETVQWRRGTRCSVDVWEFETAVAQSRQVFPAKNRQSHLEQAVSAYHGDFLPAHYDDWILAARETYRRQYLSALEELLALAETQRRYAQAIELARKLLREDPLNEAAYRRLMRLQSLNGNVAGALRTYHDCSTRLQRELGVDPAPATQAAYERLLQTKTPRAPLAPSRLPLVGRDKAWQALLAAWARCKRGQPQVALITGEAGIGKTRLAEELLDWAERQGIMALTAACYPSENKLAYAPVAALLRDEHVQPIFRRLGKRQLVECSRLLPELLDQRPDLPNPGPLTESWQRQHLFSVLAQAVLQLSQPFLLFIDDLPWCDQDTLDWLLFLLTYDPEARFLLVGAARSEEITPDHSLIAWRQQLQKDGRFTDMTLKRLNAGESALLAGHVLRQTLDEEQAERLYAETEGIPLFVVEIARASQASDAALTRHSRLPHKVQSVIEARLAQLSGPAYDLVQLASVIGRSFTFALLDCACKRESEAIVRGLDELWQRRLIRERDIEAYDFSHDKIRQVAYESLSQARRRQLHQQVWGAMETVFAKELDAVSGQIADHFEAAGQYGQAVYYYQQAAKAAQAIYANRDALDYLQRAIDLFHTANAGQQQRSEIYGQQGGVLSNIGRYRQAEKALSRAISLSTDPSDKSRLYQYLAGTQELQRQYAQAHLSLDAGEDVLLSIPRPWPEAWWHTWLNSKLKRLDLYYYTNQVEGMLRVTEEIRPIINEYGLPKQHAYYYRSLARFGFRQEQYVVSDETVANAEVAYAAAQRTDDIQLLADTRFALAFANLWYGWHGNLDKAEYHLERTLDLAEETGNVLVRARCLNYLALIHRRLGNKKEVSEFLEIALSAAEEGNLQEYIAAVEANLAWLRWSEGDLEAAKSHGQGALDIWRTLTIVFPLQWLALWPLIDIALTQDEMFEAVGYAEILLRPEMARLPTELMSVLRAACSDDINKHPEAVRTNLRTALQFARQLNQL